MKTNKLRFILLGVFVLFLHNALIGQTTINVIPGTIVNDMDRITRLKIYDEVANYVGTLMPKLSVPIDIVINESNNAADFGPGELARATSRTSFWVAGKDFCISSGPPNAVNVALPTYVVNHHSCADKFPAADFEIFVNLLNINWDYDSSPITASGARDFKSTILHEFIHGLGMNSALEFNGSNVIVEKYTVPVNVSAYDPVWEAKSLEGITIFDTFLTYPWGVPVFNLPFPVDNPGTSVYEPGVALQADIDKLENYLTNSSPIPPGVPGHLAPALWSCGPGFDLVLLISDGVFSDASFSHASSVMGNEFLMFNDRQDANGIWNMDIEFRNMLFGKSSSPGGGVSGLAYFNGGNGESASNEVWNIENVKITNEISDFDVTIDFELNPNWVPDWAVLENQSYSPSPRPAKPTIRDVRVVRLYTPNITRLRTNVYSYQTNVRKVGLPAGYYIVNVYLSDGRTLSETHNVN